MPDSSDVDAAISANLLADSALMAIAVDGVYFDVAAKSAQKFVIVSLLTHRDEYIFNDEAWEVFEYLVKAVALSTTGADVKTAAARIHTLLQDGTITPAGYGLMRMQRTERIRYTEVDADNDSRWQHRGGRYEVWMQPVAAATPSSSWMQPGWTQIGWTQ